MQATGAGNHQERLFFSGRWFAIYPAIKSDTAQLGNDFVPPAAGRANQPSDAQVQLGLPTCYPPQLCSSSCRFSIPERLRGPKNGERTASSPLFARNLGNRGRRTTAMTSTTRLLDQYLSSDRPNLNRVSWYPLWFGKDLSRHSQKITDQWTDALRVPHQAERKNCRRADEFLKGNTP